ncbi:MAG: class IV adenylate cyclase [Desulfobacterales bacterium]
MLEQQASLQEPLEIEVKFHWQDTTNLQREIAATGAVSRGRFFETNYRFDDSNDSLLKNASLLRLRHDDCARLTFKAKPRQTDTQFKTYQEYEVIVSDFETMTRILERLGYRRRQVYEKWRETFVLDDTLLCIDTMPFGNFLEIEGTREAITQFAARLGFDWELRILANYLEIFALIKHRFNLPFNDVTFQNFESVQIDIEPVIRQITAS